MIFAGAMRESLPRFILTQAKAAFDHFSPRHRREYIEWILEAKWEATVTKRIEASIDMLGEGKSRHWNYRR